MEYRKWDAKLKFQIVLEGLKNGASVSEICNRHQISQTQYYQWRDQFLRDGVKAFEPNTDKEKERLRGEIKRLKNIIGSLTIELKKNDYDD